jgi:hypothetical protein
MPNMQRLIVLAASSAAKTQHPLWADRLAWLVLASVLAAALLTFRDYGLGWDDYTHAQYGDLLLSFYSSGLRDTRALSFVNLYYYGGGFDMAAALLAKVSPFDLFETRRLLGAAVGIVGLAATWRIGRRVGGPLAGLLALLLLAACPLYYGHMFINAKDAPFAAAMAIFLLGLVRLLQEYPAPSRTTQLIIGLGFGLSIGSRILAGFGAVEAIAALVLLFALEARAGDARSAAQRLVRLLLTLIPAALLAYALMALLWPWSVENPLNPLRTVTYFSHFFEKPWRELFEGAPIKPPDMPRTYVLVLLGVKLPLLFLLLSSLGIGASLVATTRRALPPRSCAGFLALALAAIIPIAVTVITRPAMYNGIRHFIFVLPPLAALAGLAGACIVERAARFGPAAFAVLAPLFVGGVALPAVGMVRLHPYEYVYFNELVGGAKGAQSSFMLDYWGLALKQAAEALQKQLVARGKEPPERQWTIAVCGPHPPAHVALGDRFHLTWDPKGADFALMLGTFYCAMLDAPLLAEVVRDDVVFARVYDIRGRSIDSLFTTPPVEHDPR